MQKINCGNCGELIAKNVKILKITFDKHTKDFKKNLPTLKITLRGETIETNINDCYCGNCGKLIAETLSISLIKEETK